MIPANLLFPRTVYSFNEPGHEGLPIPIDCSAEIARHFVGEMIPLQAAAPGIGLTVYVVTRISASGVWARRVESSVREMTEGEAR
jgi:hypothetical protein